MARMTNAICEILALLVLVAATGAEKNSAESDLKQPMIGTNSLTPGGGAGSGTYTYFVRGNKPVISSAVVKFTKDDLNKGTEPDSDVRKYARSLGEAHDDAGHIYANELGGLAVPINIFPQSPHINRGAYRSLEMKIYKCMKEGGASSATLSWQFAYDGTSSTRPTGVTYSASFDSGCSDMSKQFDNPSAQEAQEAVVV